MPRAGWCKECGEWVWVDAEGGCQHGHGPECVEQIHDQAYPPQSEHPFGEGKPPTALFRFNWGAFLLPFFWGAAYGAWPVVGAWAVAALSPVLLGGMFGTGDEFVAVSTLVGVTIASEVIAGLARLWAGANANMFLWKREAFRLELLPTYRSRFSVERFLARQRVWTAWGAGVLALGSLLSIPVYATIWQKYGLTYVGAAVPLVWLAAEIVLGLWLDSRMRAEPPDLEQTAKTPV